VNTAVIRELEERAFAAWPAEQVDELGGWRLRFTHGVTRRANSVWPAQAEPERLAELIAGAEAFYAAQAQPTLFQLSPVAAPAGLDQELERRGYSVEAPVDVQVAEVAGVIAALERRNSPVWGEPRVARQPSAAWFELSALRGRFAAVANIYRALLQRLGDRAAYVSVERDGRAGAVALGVKDGPWMGLFAMTTAAELRRRGLGAAVLRQLAQFAGEAGCQRMYLQVERDNVDARALYQGAGFATAYGYHYRRSPLTRSLAR
jgi:ribosomal protein S18 acetylase RimI-like enzyme